MLKFSSNNMTDDELIDNILFELNKYYPNGLFYKNYLGGTLKLEREKVDQIIKFLESEDLALLKNKLEIIISKKGLQICKDGGWLKHRENIKNEHKYKLFKEQLEIDLAQSNIEANQINKKATERNRKQNIFIICATILNLILLAIQLYIMSKSK